MRAIYKVLLLLEVVACFTPMTALLAVGALMTPMVLASMFMDFSLNPESWLGAAWISGSVFCGSCGLVTLTSVLSRLLGARRSFARPALVLAGAALGVLPIVPFLIIPGWGRLYALAPIAATAHLIYLSRRMLFPRRADSAAESGPGTSAARRTKEACAAR